MRVDLTVASGNFNLCEVVIITREEGLNYHQISHNNLYGVVIIILSLVIMTCKRVSNIANTQTYILMNFLGCTVMYSG